MVFNELPKLFFFKISDRDFVVWSRLLILEGLREPFKRNPVA